MLSCHGIAVQRCQIAWVLAYWGMLGCQECWVAWMLACWGIELRGYSDAQRLGAGVLRCWHDGVWSCCRDSEVQGCCVIWGLRCRHAMLMGCRIAQVLAYLVGLLGYTAAWKLECRVVGSHREGTQGWSSDGC